VASKKMISVNRYAQCSESNMSTAEAARELGVTEGAVYAAGRKFGLKFRDGRVKRKESSNEQSATTDAGGRSSGA
jgi:hypothetical protein